MDFLYSVILGIVEGITEFLPISSTGHLILVSDFLKLTQNEFVKSFEIAIQLGAILAVVVLYWRKLLVDIEVMKRIVAAFLPTAVLGLILYKFIKHFLLGNVTVVILSLFVGGVILIAFECLHKEKPGAINDLAAISYQQAVIIGIFQSLAIIPGVSRSAATIIGGLLLGIKRQTIVEFSFLLAVPTMMAATALDLLKSAHHFGGGQIEVLGVGFLVSFAVAILSIKFLLHFIKNHTFIAFGIYRVVLSAAYTIKNIF